MTDIFVPIDPHPENPGGATYTTFLGPARVITPDLFADVTDEVPIVMQYVDEVFGEVYFVHFENDLTDDQRVLAILVAQGNPTMDALIKGAKNAVGTNKDWANNTVPQILTQANNIANATGTGVSATDKQLANGIKVLAKQLEDVTRQNNQLIKYVLGLFADGA